MFDINIMLGDFPWLATAILVLLAVFIIALTYNIVRTKGIDGRLSEFKKDVKDELGDLRKSVEKILHSLPPPSQKPITKTSSPITLTDEGRKLSVKINARGLVSKYHNKIELASGLAAYEIQEICFSFAEERLFELLSPDEKKFVLSTAYSTGRTKEDLMKVVGVEMRDYFLKERRLQAS